MVPVPLFIFVDMADSFTRGNFKNKWEENKNYEIKKSFQNDLTFISYHDVIINIRFLFGQPQILRPKNKIISGNEISIKS